MINRIKLTAVIAVMTLGITACGLTLGNDDGSGETGDEAPPVAGMCAEEQPDCQDTVVVPDDGAEDPDIQYRPIEPEGDVAGDGVLLNDGRVVAVDGNLVTIGFWMGVEDCYAVEYVEVTETDSLVTIDISIASRDLDAVCIEIAEARSVTVELSEPPGDRAVQVGEVVISD